MCEKTCRTSPARSILTSRGTLDRAASAPAFECVSRGGGDFMRRDSKVMAVSLSSEGVIESGTSGEVGNSWRPARSPTKKIDQKNPYTETQYDAPPRSEERRV